MADVKLIDSTNSLVGEVLADLSIRAESRHVTSKLGDDSIYVISSIDYNDDGTKVESEMTADDGGNIIFTHCGMEWTIDKDAERVSVRVLDATKVYNALASNNDSYDGTSMSKISPDEKLARLRRANLYRNADWTWLNDTARKFVLFIVKCNIRHQLELEKDTTPTEIKPDL